MALGDSSLVASILLSVVGADEVIAKMGEVGAATRGAGAAADEGGAGIAGGMGKVGVAAVVAATAITAWSVHTAAAYQEGMDKVHGFAGASAADMAYYNRAILASDVQLGQSAKNMASGLYYVISAGFKGKEAMDVLKASTMAAAASGADQATVTDAVTTALNAYHLSGTKAMQVTDVLSKSVVEGKTTWQELASAIGRPLTIAPALGASLADVGAVLATLTNRGFTARLAAMSLQSAMRSMLAPTSAQRTAMEALGLSTDVVTQVHQRGLIPTMEKFYNAAVAGQPALADLIAKHHLTASAAQTLADNLANSNNRLKDVFGTSQALAMVLSLASDHFGMLNRNAKGTADAMGTTKHAFDIAAEGFNFKLAQMGVAIGNVGIAIGSRLIPVLTPLLGALAATATGLAGNSQLWNELGTILGKVGNAIGFAVNFFLILAQTIGPMLTPAIKSLGTALQPIGDLLQNLADWLNGFASQGSYAGDSAHAMALKVNELNPALQAAQDAAMALQGPIQVISTVLQTVVGILTALAPVIEAAAAAFVAYHVTVSAITIATGAWTAAQALLTVAVNAYRWTVLAAQIATEGWSGAQEVLNLLLVANPIGIVIAAIALLVVGVIEAYNHVGWFRDAVNAAWSAIKQFAAAVINDAGAALKWLEGALQTVISWVQTNWPLVLHVLQNPFQVILPIIETFGKNVLSTIGSMVSGVLGKLGQMKDGALSAVQSMISVVISALEHLAAAALSYGAHVAENFASGILSGIGAVAHAAGSLVGAALGHLGFKSPNAYGVDFEQYGRNAATAWARGLASGVDAVKSAGGVLVAAAAFTLAGSLSTSTGAHAASSHAGQHVLNQVAQQQSTVSASSAGAGGAAFTAAVAQLPPSLAAAMGPVTQKFTDGLAAAQDKYTTGLNAENEKYHQKRVAADTQEHQRLTAENTRHEQAISGINERYNQQVASIRQRSNQEENNYLQNHHIQINAANQATLEKARAQESTYLERRKAIEQTILDAHGKNAAATVQRGKEQLAALDAQHKRQLDQTADMLGIKNREHKQLLDQWLANHKHSEDEQLAKAKQQKDDALAKEAVAHKNHVDGIVQAHSNHLTGLAQAHATHIQNLQKTLNASVDKIEKAMGSAAAPAAIWTALQTQVNKVANDSLGALSLALLTGKGNVDQLSKSAIDAARNEQTLTEKKRQAQVIVDQGSGQFAAALSSISGKITGDMSNAVSGVTLDILNHGAATQADVDALVRAKTAQDQFTDAQLKGAQTVAQTTGDFGSFYQAAQAKYGAAVDALKQKTYDLAHGITDNLPPLDVLWQNVITTGNTMLDLNTASQSVTNSLPSIVPAIVSAFANNSNAGATGASSTVGPTTSSTPAPEAGAWNAGYAAAQSGTPTSANPYGSTGGSMYAAWYQGYASYRNGGANVNPYAVSVGGLDGRVAAASGVGLMAGTMLTTNGYYATGGSQFALGPGMGSNPFTNAPGGQMPSTSFPGGSSSLAPALSPATVGAVVSATTGYIVQTGGVSWAILSALGLTPGSLSQGQTALAQQNNTLIAIRTSLGEIQSQITTTAANTGQTAANTATTPQSTLTILQNVVNQLQAMLEQDQAVAQAALNGSGDLTNLVGSAQQLAART